MLLANLLLQLLGKHHYIFCFPHELVERFLLPTLLLARPFALVLAGLLLVFGCGAGEMVELAKRRVVLIHFDYKRKSLRTAKKTKK